MKYALIIFITAFASSCDSSEENEIVKDISGTWSLTKIWMNSSMVNPEPPTESIYSKIIIEFPDSLANSVSGNTFMNSIWVQFLIEDDLINFSNYGGSRIAEDPIGDEFKEHILSSTNFSLNDENLLLYDDNGVNVLIFKKEIK